MSCGAKRTDPSTFCLSKSLLRKMLTISRDVLKVQPTKQGHYREFGIYAKKGGLHKHNDHNHVKGLFHTIYELVNMDESNDLQVHDWIKEDHIKGNPHLGAYAKHGIMDQIKSAILTHQRPPQTPKPVRAARKPKVISPYSRHELYLLKYYKRRDKQAFKDLVSTLRFAELIDLTEDKQAKAPRVASSNSQFKAQLKQKIQQHQWLSSRDIHFMLTRFITHDKVKVLDTLMFNSQSGRIVQKRIQRQPQNLAIVFNTDASDQGIHWIALYIDFSHKSVYYIDPYGEEPTDHTKQWINTYIRTTLKRTYRQLFHLRISHQACQKDGWSCGYWSIWILYQLAEKGLTLEDIQTLWKEQQIDVAKFLQDSLSTH